MPENNSTGEKTESATPKRRQDARKRGQVLKSNEIVMTGTLLVMFASLRILAPIIGNSLMNFSATYWAGQYYTGEGIMTQQDSLVLMQNMTLGFLQIMLPILLVAVLGAVVVNIVQTGYLFSTEALMPKMSRLSLIEGFKRMFSFRTVFELLKSILKIAVIGFLIYTEIESNMTEFSRMMSESIGAGIIMIAEMIFNAAFMILVFLMIIAIFDYLYQKRKFEKDLMMTKYEVRMEMKQQEGDPQIKGKIRQKQRQMSMMRMMQSVPDADVIITNPTHYAIALKYDEKVGSAPIVLAKGKDFVAQRIKEVAKEHSIETVENVTLARSLYVMCDIGDLIPVDMYQAVAEILAQVYRKKNNIRH